MLASIFKRKATGNSQDERSPLLPRIRRQGASQDNLSPGHRAAPYNEEQDTESSDGSDGGPLLPIFSSAVLDKIPVYHLQHTIRLLIVQKCETTLSWEQLRSPQISQFLVKPIQQQIQENCLTRGTLYALISNGLQFEKEAQTNPGIVGISRTRALLCELLAMRFLKDSSTHELIDALFYDFDPLQGFAPIRTSTIAAPVQRAQGRISCVEIAIRAQSKRFLAHPLVVQQLEAIWAGTIVFHSVADHLHRKPPKAIENRKVRGTNQDTNTMQRPAGSENKHARTGIPVMRRSVTLYNPRESSIFKLSRLRVPRYRQLFSTLSYGVMLGLFLAVLTQRSLDITALELLFWFWSAGYMLDEVVGFTEQGFGLYIMSFWNAFDVGILLLFVIYYVLRLYGIVVPGAHKRQIANQAYDVLASTAVLLFPRLFSVLDHYPYFSQLLIAFRLMAVDLVAILILLVIACSGFFVAFTLSFSDKDFNAASAAYAIFQIVMGFTPAAWDLWPGYNLLGKALLTIFLIICHFMIVTILITVLTNSFMAIVRNANEEHQFLFAVNTISMVKSDALFSYIPPTNVLGWLLAPLRWVMPFRSFVKINRTLIKATHIPILMVIFCYERLFLARLAYEPAEMVEQRGRPPSRVPAFSVRGPTDLFSPGIRLREPSVTTYHKDRALDEVFRRPFRTPLEGEGGPIRRNSAFDRGHHSTSDIVQNWMRGLGQQGLTPSDPQFANLQRPDFRRPNVRRFKTAQAVTTRRRLLGAARTVASDPAEDAANLTTPNIGRRRQEDYGFPAVHSDDIPQQTDADGDDELNTNDDDDRREYEQSLFDSGSRGVRSGSQLYATSRQQAQSRAPSVVQSITAKSYDRGSLRIDVSVNDFAADENRPQTSRQILTISPPGRERSHNRNASSATILFYPLKPDHGAESGSSGALERESKSMLAQPPPTMRALSDPPATVPALSINAPPTLPPPAQPTTAARRAIRRSQTNIIIGANTNSGSSSRPTTSQPKQSSASPTKNLKPTTPSRPIAAFSNNNKYYSSPNLVTLLQQRGGSPRKPSFNAIALDLASEIGDNKPYLPDVNQAASFGTGVEMAAWADRWRRNRDQHHHDIQRQRRGRDGDGNNNNADRDRRTLSRSRSRSRSRSPSIHRRAREKDTSTMMNRMMIERMTNLEAGFKEVLREVKRVSRAGSIDDDVNTHSGMIATTGFGSPRRGFGSAVNLAAVQRGGVGRGKRPGSAGAREVLSTSAGERRSFLGGGVVGDKGKGKAKGKGQGGEWIDEP